MKFCFTTKDFIEAQIEPNKLAISGADRDISWAEFSAEVNNLCDFLMASGYKKNGNSVIVYGHKNASMLVAIYSCIKLEIPYIPVDVIYPKQRIQKIVSTAGVQLVLNTTYNPFPVDSLLVLNVENGTPNSAVEIDWKGGNLKADPIIYTLFTSGSTGEPKGVQITTEAIQSFTRWMSADFGFSSSDVFVNTAILSFDLSVFEVMTFAAIGGSIILNDKETCSNPDLLLSRVKKYGGLVWVSTPSFALIYSRIEDLSPLNSLKAFLFCGEVLPNPLAKKLLDKLPNATVFNTYGPTEATVATTQVVITPEIVEQHNPLPVGEPRPESELIIENDEIIIVGPHVSVGYLNQPELNAQKFLTINGKRAFKTGDKGYLENNMLFFKGRNDDLVKLHGYRIELNEITSVMLDVVEVQKAETIALKRNGETKKIVSLAVLKDDFSVEDLKLKMAERLPHYMIPSDIKLVDDIPLTQNGKADKKKLQEIYMKR
jgi:D-alanine--poly(phosphoribitol) ligase subunit 1